MTLSPERSSLAVHRTTSAGTRKVEAKKGSRRNRVWHTFRRRPTTLLGGIILVLLVAVSLGAEWLSAYDPSAVIPADSLQSPNWQHPFGTDRLGRDQFARILYGGRLSLGVGIISVGVALVLGVPLGLVAGYWQGWIDRVISRYTDVLLAFPNFLLALTIVFVLGPSLRNVMLAVGVSSSPTFIRLVRGLVMQLHQSPFVDAARACGCTDRRIMVLHILPNTISPIVIMATLGLGNAILSAAALSFLGVGVQPPTPEWGVMLNEGRMFMRTAWWLTTIPGLAILLAVLSINLIGDGLRDALDPRRN